VDACTIMRDPDGRSRGFAFLTFDEPESVNAVTGREHILDGKAVSVNLVNFLILLMCQ
jgi:RNA-binding protein Musashi